MRLTTEIAWATCGDSSDLKNCLTRTFRYQKSQGLHPSSRRGLQCECCQSARVVIDALRVTSVPTPRDYRCIQTEVRCVVKQVRPRAGSSQEGSTHSFTTLGSPRTESGEEPLCSDVETNSVTVRGFEPSSGVTCSSAGRWPINRNACLVTYASHVEGGHVKPERTANGTCSPRRITSWVF